MRPRRWDGVPAAFQRHLLFSTADPTAAERLGSALLGRHRLVVHDGSAPFAANLHAVVTGHLTIGYLRLCPAMELELAGSAPRFLVVAPQAGGAGSITASGVDVAPAQLVQPGRRTTVRWPSGAVHLVIGIERSALLAHLSRLLGRPLGHPLAFAPELDLTAGSASRWNLAVDMLHAELSEQGSLLRAGLGQRPLEDFLMSSLLLGQPSTYSADLRRPAPSPAHPAARAALRFIDRNLCERLSAARVASAAGVSPRTLQSVFRSELRTTPTAYIRGQRLDRVRADLAAAAGGCTVTDVATRWGISHLSRFASEYRERFGESPSETLRRARVPAAAEPERGPSWPPDTWTVNG